MTIAGLIALCGLALAWWGYDARNGQTFAYGLVLTLAAPLLRLLVGSPVKGSAATTSAVDTPGEAAASAPPSQTDAEIAAKIEAFRVAKQAYYAQHVKL